MLNKVILIGRLGNDPESRYLESGELLCNFTLATNDYYTDKSGQKQTTTEWHKLVAFGKVAELCSKYLKKGSQAYFEGKLKTSSYNDKEGHKRYSTNIQISVVKFLNSPERSEGIETIEPEGEG